MPGEGATAVRVTVPVSGFEPISEVVLRVSELRVIGAGCRVMVWDRFTPVGSVAVTVTEAGASTGLASTVVWPVEAPPVELMGCGVATTLVLLEVNVAVYPLAGAGPLSVVEPVAVVGLSPAVSVDGVIENALSEGGLTVTLPCRLTAPCVAVMVTLFEAASWRFAEIRKLALVAP